MNIDILKQVKVLYVEDDEAIREILSKGLKRKVKEIQTACDGLDGLEKYRSFQPNIIITDIKMPRMNGLEMVTKIREIDLSIPIIITSAHDESGILLEAISLGVNGYLLKPIDKNKLIDTIILYAKPKILESELKRKNKQMMMQSKNAALGELIENIAHQWRQPLSVISATAGNIQIGNELDTLKKEDIEKFSNDIINTTQDLSKTIEYFRSMFISNEKRKDIFNISNVIRDVVMNLRIKLDQNKITIVKNIDEELSFESNKNIFLQSLDTILINAIDAFEDSDIQERYIFIEVKQTEDTKIINIKDNAGGIIEENLDKVFEPYFTTRHKTDGKGLGLHSTLIMIENGMGGTIEVCNELFEYKKQKCKGALFTIKVK